MFGLNRKHLSWMLYDWASSPVPTLHTTFIFSVYFTTQIMPEDGSFYWSQMVAFSALSLGVLAPFLGRLADRTGRIKQALILFSLLGATATALLWFASPSAEWAAYALLLSAISIFCVEIAFVFYNAFLPSISTPERFGYISGMGWGLGYFGAIIALSCVLMGFIMPEQPLFFTTTDELEHIRFTMVFAGLWLVIFALPLMFFCPAPERKTHPMGSGLISDTKSHLKRAVKIPGMLRFLLARMAFNDGLVTLFAFGGIYAAKIFQFSQTEIIIFAISLNITAGIGACIAAPLNDRFDSLFIIRFCLICLVLLGGICILATTAMLFWAAGLALGLFIGPCQSAARVYIAASSPQKDQASMFGLFMLSGKLTSFIGPLLYGWLVIAFDTERAGMSIVLILLTIGFLLLPKAGSASS